MAFFMTNRSIPKALIYLPCLEVVDLMKGLVEEDGNVYAKCDGVQMVL